MQSMRSLLVIITLGILASTAHAACPDRRASCVLHEEGVALLMEKQYEDAAKKFAAAIAAEPTARSYLGYAQAVESLGQIALSYDTMVAAQKLSEIEVSKNPGDPSSSRQDASSTSSASCARRSASSGCACPKVCRRAAWSA
jgi:hypothetical protein